MPVSQTSLSDEQTNLGCCCSVTESDSPSSTCKKNNYLITQGVWILVSWCYWYRNTSQYLPPEVCFIFYAKRNCETWFLKIGPISTGYGNWALKWFFFMLLSILKKVILYLFHLSPLHFFIDRWKVIGNSQHKFIKINHAWSCLTVSGMFWPVCNPNKRKTFIRWNSATWGWSGANHNLPALSERSSSC